MELTYQTADESDIDRIFRQSRTLIEQYEDLASIDVPKVYAWVRGKISANIVQYRRILFRGQLAGYYRLAPAGNQLELDDFYVLPAFRGRGIGSEVLRCCCAAGEPLMLYVFRRNTRAIALYRRFGFEITDAVGQTRYMMRRPADASQEDL